MKEKIRQLAKENFEYALSNILLSQENLQITVEAGSTYMGSFFVSNDEERDMKGIVYTSFSNLKITNPMFIGKNNEIQFIYDARKLPYGQEQSGILHIVSNCGEVSLSVQVQVTKPCCMTSLGQIRDLFQFANLARSHWEEALKLFESADFERVFLKHEDLKARYHSLMRGDDSNLAMEEFLISIQKKQKINIRLERTSYEYKNCLTDFMDKVVIEKDSWGYQSFHASTDCRFLKIQKKDFTSKDFCGNRYELEFLIERHKLGRGNNFGKIQIKGLNETQEITVRISAAHDSAEKKQRRKKKEFILFFMQSYLNLRTEQIAYDKYIADLAELVKNSSDCCPYWAKKLLELHFYIMDHQTAAEEVLAEMEARVEEIKEESLLSYTAFLYLRAMYTRKEEAIREAVTFIRAYYENGFDSWQMLWFLIQLDEEYDSRQEKKWRELADCIDRGANSPVLYFEALKCLKDDRGARVYFQKSLPKLLLFGMKMSFLTEELISLFCFLAEQDGQMKPWAMRGLYSIYRNTGSREALYAVCKLLIQNQKQQPHYFSWFEKGEAEKLKLENLYEYYIYTMEESFSHPIPANLFRFFQYDNQLSFEKRAFFYAYIIKNKHRDLGNYIVYDRIMRDFAREALKKEKIDRNLAILYEEFFRPEDVDERLALAFGNIMFRHELICEDSKMTGVYVRHKELSKEVYTPLVNGRCYVDLFTENPSVVFADAKGNRCWDSVSHNITKLLHIQGLSERCYESCRNNTMLLLHLFEKIFKYQMQKEDAVLIQRRCVLLPAFQPFYRGYCFENLIQYYFEHMEAEALKEMLSLADFDLLTAGFRPKAIYYCMIYELTERACFLMQQYGFEQIPLNRMIHFCTEEIRKCGMDNKNKFLLQMAFYIFDDEKYNETILQYLMRHLEGDTATLRKLWKRCVNFELEAYSLEERILSQVLFTEEKVMKTQEVFCSYYKKGGDEKLIRAYLAYTSYQYLMKESPTVEALFPLLKKESFYEESTVGILAKLLFYSKQEVLLAEELAFCEKHIRRMVEEGRIFPFFKQFAGKVKLPQKVLLYHYVEYRCHPKNKVKIHYILEDNRSQEDYVTKYMENVYFGIHVAPFLLFHDEVLQYYISEEEDGQERITESVRVEQKNYVESTEEGTFELLNLILTAKEMKDEKTMLALMEQYIKFKYACGRLLKILP